MNQPPKISVTYHAEPFVRFETGEKEENTFEVFETIGQNFPRHCFILKNEGNILDELLKRGLPLDQAQKVFGEIIK